MMTEKGFATIFGLCLILVIALVVKGIQESEMNHAYETTDFQTEFELKNAADSGIYEAAESIYSRVKNNEKWEDILPPARTYHLSNSRKAGQKNLIPLKKIFTDKNIEVEVWGERLVMKHFKEIYPSYGQEDLNDNDEVCVLLSKAELQSARMDGKIYCRAFAYISFNEDGTIDKTIHFMALPSSKD